MGQRIWLYKRAAISTFLIVHLLALMAYNMPPCSIKTSLYNFSVAYLHPLGLWQNWSMFAPDPSKYTVMLEALAIDKNGQTYNFAFPRMTDYTVLDGVTKARHPKFTSYLNGEDFEVMREVGARHVVRQLRIPPEAFPVAVELQFVVRDTPPPGSVPDRMAPTRIESVKYYKFSQWQETQK
jgi:hypothetical protein